MEAPQRVFVTGGSGFVGTNVLERLVADDIQVSTLARDGNVSVDSPLVSVTKGGLFDADALRGAMDGCDAVIHLVGIIFEKPGDGVTFERIHVEGTRAVLEAMAATGVKRLVHMSALGARPDAVSKYHRTKFAAEELVRQSDVSWTIFRPSMIHGPRGDFMRQAAGWARGKAVPFIFMPYFGKGVTGFGGSGRIQPVYVKDVASAFVEAVGNPKAFGRVYNLCGPDVMTWPQMHHVISKTVRGRKKAAVPVPAWYAKLLAKVAPAGVLPFNLAQVQMSQEDNVGDTTEFLADFDITPAAFEPTVASYADQL